MRTESQQREGVEQRTARWLTTIAELELMAAADIDEGGFSSEVAAWLRCRAADCAATVSAASDDQAPARPPRLRLMS